MKIKTNGITLNVHASGTGAVTLLYLHYWGGSSRTWAPVIEALPAGYRHVAVDLRGWGESDHPAAGYDLADMTNDLRGVVEALALERYILVGHSMGAKVAQAFAAERPSGLLGLVLVAPSPPLPLALSDEQRAGIAHAYDHAASIGAALDHVLGGSTLSGALRAQVIEDSLRGAPAARQSWPYRAMAEDIAEQAARIAVPVAVLSGELDQVDPPTALRTHLLPIIRQAGLEIVPGCGHLLPLQAPEAVAAAIGRFASGLAPADRLPIP